MTSDFDLLCELFEKISPEAYLDIITEKSANVIGALSELTGDVEDGFSVFLNFILCSIMADGRLDTNEYILIEPFIKAIFDRDVTYEEAERLFVIAGLDKPEGFKDAVDRMVDMLGMLSKELKDDIIVICMMICAIDGKITDDEKAWIKQLIE